MKTSPHLGRASALLVAGALALTTLSTPSFAVPSAPVITPPSGSWLAGPQTVVAMPSTRGDKVTALAVDGTALTAVPEYGDSVLSFAIGSNSLEARYGSHLFVNGHRIDLTARDYVNETVEIPVPNEWLTAGANTITWQVGTFPTSCGANHDDYVVSAPKLTTGGPVEAAVTNRPVYSLGDGNCGSNASLLTRFDLSYTLGDDPTATVGLTADVDTTTLADGQHTISATTASGGTASNLVNVNNGQPGSAIITPGDGAVLNGTQTVLATPQGADAVTSLALDGTPLATVPTLGAGSSALRFTVGTNSAEARFRNYVLVNGHQVFLDRTVVNGSYDLPIPNEHLRVGTNTLDFRTGALQESCGANNDDFDLSKLSLVLSQGTATGVDIKSRYQMGDGSCGTSPARLTSAVLTFQVSATPMGLAAQLDTADHADGTHVVTAVTASGATSRRTYTFDNTGPVPTSSITAGARLTTATLLDVTATDATGVRGTPTITVDGEPVVNGSSIGAGMAAGNHTLVITATDVLGNPSTTTIAFSTASIPAPIVDAEATKVGDQVELSATVTDPDGGPVTATFYEAAASLPTQVTTGQAVELPTGLDIDGTTSAATGLMPNDDRMIDSLASEDLSLQRFDLDADGLAAAGMQAQWQGVVDPQRSASLYLWDTAAKVWEKRATARGQQSGNTALVADVAARHLDGDQVHALVVGEDPFADDINKPVDNAFADPSAYDFSIAHYSDTQYLSEGAVEQESAAERAEWAAAYRDLVQWIVDNADDKKIAYAAHTGDVTENSTRKPATPAMEAQVKGEFEFASATQKILDDSGIPNGVLAGNHDNWTGANHDLFNTYFGPDRYEAVSKNWKNASYGGGWREGDNQNHYDLFSAGGLDFIAVHLSYDVQPEEIAWANEVLTRYKDRNAILMSHAYLNTSTEEDGRNAPYSAAGGLYQFEGIVAKNPNVFLTLSGHHHGVGINVIKDAGTVGNDVVELLADYQFYAPTAEELGLTEIGGYSPTDTLRFGSSFLRLLQFDVDRSELIVDTYSPYLDNFNATEYDLEDRYNGTEDDFVVPIELTTRQTTLQTDSMALVAPTGRALGSDTVASGDKASALVDQGRISAWYVVAVTGNGGTTTSQIVLLPAGLAVPRTVIVALPTSRKSFGFEVTGDIPEGSRLQVTWTRNGKAMKADVDPNAPWTSGNQTQWRDAKATLVDEVGVVATSDVVNPPAGTGNNGNGKGNDKDS